MFSTTTKNVCFFERVTFLSVRFSKKRAFFKKGPCLFNCALLQKRTVSKEGECFGGRGEAYIVPFIFEREISETAGVFSKKCAKLIKIYRPIQAYQSLISFLICFCQGHTNTSEDGQHGCDYISSHDL